MGYLHIDNLYKNQTVLLFRECYALEKVHGTSAHIEFKDGDLTFFSGGEKHDRFVSLFDCLDLKGRLGLRFVDLGPGESATIFGEAYGGSQQGMRDSYGNDLRFIVFDIKIAGLWLCVPQMDECAKSLGLEVVPWVRTDTSIEALNKLMAEPSRVAQIRGCGVKQSEGIVIRPLIELTKNNGDRVIAKHKNHEFRERETNQTVSDPLKAKVLSHALAIANEWVTPMRLSHVLDKMPIDAGMEQIPAVISAMIEDVIRESAGEIVDSREARSAIGKRAAVLFRERLRNSLI